jgi:hypothetical protein
MHRCYSRFASAARIGAAVACCGLLLLAGCSSDPWGKRVTVQGKITLADGKPVPGGLVTFVPMVEGPIASRPPTADGMIGEDGSYTLGTKGKPGAHLGKYRVVLSPGVDKQAWSQVPRQYTRKRSPLEVEVEENKPEGGYDLKIQPQSGQRR